jgi:hypothetical protein
MATRIIEFLPLDPSAIGAPIVPAGNLVTEQTALTTTTSPTPSAVFDARTGLVCIQSDEAVYVKFGTNPTATVNSYRIQAGQEQFFLVPAGQGQKVSVRQ